MSRLKSSGGGLWIETRHTPYRDPAEIRRIKDLRLADPFVWQVFRPSYRNGAPALPIMQAQAADPIWKRLGFELLIRNEGYDLLIVAPYWAAVLVGCVPFMMWLLIRERRKQINKVQGEFQQPPA